MEIKNRVFEKYQRPIFFGITRTIVYLAFLLVLAGGFAMRNESDYVFINFFIMLGIAVTLILIDVYFGIKKAKTYKQHFVKFEEDCFVFADHVGTYRIPYDKIKSYQLISDQLWIRVGSFRFVIGAKIHGINVSELKEMVDLLVDKDIERKTGFLWSVILVIFLVINFGSDYLFMEVMGMDRNQAYYLVLYVLLGLAIGVTLWQRISVNNYKLKGDKNV